MRHYRPLRHAMPQLTAAMPPARPPFSPFSFALPGRLRHFDDIFERYCRMIAFHFDASDAMPLLMLRAMRA